MMTVITAVTIQNNGKNLVGINPKEIFNAVFTSRY